MIQGGIFSLKFPESIPSIFKPISRDALDLKKVLSQYRIKIGVNRRREKSPLYQHLKETKSQFEKPPTL